MVARKYDDLVPSWIDKYEGGKNIYEIGAEYGVSPQSVWAKFRQAGFKLRSKSIAMRRLPLREGAFDDSTNPEMCYWLGLLFADGCIHERDRLPSLVGLVANNKDLESLTGFLKFLGATHKIMRRKDKEASQVIISSRRLVDALGRYGAVPRKTHIIRFPDLPAANRRHFVRGYFDGDGSVYFRIRPRYITPQGTVSFSGNPAFINDLANVIRDDVGVTPVSRQAIGKNKESAQIRYEGRNKLIALCEYLYSANGPSLTRKRSEFDKLNIAPLSREEIGRRTMAKRRGLIT